MYPLYLSLWILAYTLSLVTIVFGFFYYQKHRLSSLKYYLIHKLVLLAVILLFMISLLTQIQSFLFQLLLFNILGLMNFNMSRMIFSFPRQQGPFWLTFILPMIIQILLNVLLIFQWDDWIYPFFAIMFTPIILSSILVQKAPGKIPLFPFWKSLPACTGFMALVTGICIGFYLVLLFGFGPIESEGFYHFYFSLFYMLINAISLSYFLYQIQTHKDMNYQECVTQTEKLLSTTYALTSREIEVLHQLVEGHSYQTIADRCFISLSTVKKHSNSIYRKTGNGNGRQLSQWYNELKNTP